MLLLEFPCLLRLANSVSSSIRPPRRLEIGRQQEASVETEVRQGGTNVDITGIGPPTMGSNPHYGLKRRKPRYWQIDHSLKRLCFKLKNVIASKSATKVL